MLNLDPVFLSCPSCGGELHYRYLGSASETSCSKCGYIEKAGSQHIVEFVSAVMMKYIAKKGISSIVAGQNGKLSLNIGLCANGILPILVARANEYRIGNLALTDVLTHSDILTSVRDDKGLFGKRVVFDGNSEDVDETLFCVAQQLIPLTYTIDETILFSAKRLNIHASKITTLYLDDIPTLGLDKSLDTPTQSQSDSKNTYQGMEQ